MIKTGAYIMETGHIETGVCNKDGDIETGTPRDGVYNRDGGI